MKLEWKTCLKVGVSIFVLYLCIHYWPALSGLLSTLLGAALPLVIGCIIAYMVNILMSFYERHFPAKAAKVRRPICMVGAYLTMIAMITLVVGLVVPQLWSCVQLILAELPDFLDHGMDLVRRWGILPENLAQTLANIDWQSRVGEIVQTVGSGLGSVMDVVIQAISSVFSGIVTGFLSLIFSFYLLLSKDKLKGQFHRLMLHYLPDRLCRKIEYVAGILDDCFHSYIVGQCTEAVILGLLCAIGMWILRLPYAAMVGALIAFTALIPVAGAYIGTIVACFMILTVSPMKALVFLIFILVLQQLENNLIYPKVVGSSLGLPGIWVLAAVTVGGGVMGVAGMLIGVPLTAALYRLIREDLNKAQRIEEKQEPEPEENPEQTE